MDYFFDTNIFRRASENDSIKTRLLDFKSRLGTNGRTWVCELTLLELNSQLRRDKSLYYQQRKAGMLFARELTDGRVLPLPDYFLRNRFFNTATIEDLEKYRLNWDIYWRHLEASKSITSFKRKPSKSFNRAKTLERVAVNSWGISKIRDQIEKSYVRSMGFNGWISNTAYSKHRKDKLDPLWARVRELVESPEFAWEIYRAIAERCGIALIRPTERTPLDKLVMDELCAFMTAYKWVLNKMLESEYNYIKNKNDYIDIHLLPYLARNDMTLVTLDGRLKAKIGACSTQASRVLSIDELTGLVHQQR